MSFDLEAFKSAFSSIEGTNPRDCYVSLAKTAEAAERYTDMCSFMREMITGCDANLNEEERNLLSVAYKNVIGVKRMSWRTLKGGSESPVSDVEQALTTKYTDQVEQELKDCCDDVLGLLKNHLVPAAAKDTEDSTASVFYLKMAGDYFRYRAESSDTQEDKQAAGDYYDQAYELAKQHLKPTHPIRLGLALNYSVCHYEILKNPKEACELAKQAFDEAISKLDKLKAHEYKDSTLIMQLLRDNLTLWTSAADGGDANIEVEDFSDNEAA